MDRHNNINRNFIFIEKYIKPQTNSQRLIEAFQNVPRHYFVEQEFKDKAYEDRPLPIGEYQTISQPSLVAKMTDLLKLTGKEKVLEIGTGSGYQSAILSKMCKEVYTVERIEKLAKQAKQKFKNLKLNNIHTIIADGSKGLPKEAPYDAIIVTAASKEIPQPLIDQLGDNARMVIPVEKNDMNQFLLLVTKTNKKVLKKKLIPVVFVPLITET